MTEIILEDVDESKKVKAKDEIETLLNDVFGKENPIATIMVTNSFQEEIQKFTEIPGSKIVYDSHHEYGTALAKTIPYIKNGKLMFTIILDSTIFGRWINEEYFTRTAILVHELIHVKDDVRRWTEIGMEFFREPKGKREGLFHNAWVIWEEYKANKVVAEVFENVIKERGGRVDYSFALGHADKLHDLLKNIRDYANQNIQDFRNWKLTPTEICYRITSRICGILILCAYTYAVVDLSNELKERMAQIETLEGYQFLLSPNWPKIYSVLKELYLNANKYLPELIDKIADEIDAIYRRCGLEISDAEEGFWLNVRDIE